jgi:hypothetical protein
MFNAAFGPRTGIARYFVLRSFSFMAIDFTFAYGSSMNRSDLRSWLESNGYDSSLVTDSGLAILEDYDYVWNYFSEKRRGGGANLERKDGCTICGVLIEFDQTLMKAFDRKEGHPFFYSRGEQRIPVRKLNSAETVSAWIYLARPNRGVRRDIWPTREYKRIVMEAANFWNFPEDCLRKIQEWQTQ